MEGTGRTVGWQVGSEEVSQLKIDGESKQIKRNESYKQVSETF